MLLVVRAVARAAADRATIGVELDDLDHVLSPDASVGFFSAQSSPMRRRDRASPPRSSALTQIALGGSTCWVRPIAAG
jgi:hypothetical protein